MLRHAYAERDGSIRSIRVLFNRPTVIVPVDIRESVCFVYIKRRGRDEPIGTAFFWGIEVVPGRFGCVVVTAMHVVVQGREKADDGCIYLRVNTTRGGFDLVKMRADAWVIPDQSEEAIDVAAAVWRYGRDVYDFKFTNKDHAATLEVIAESLIGPGDEVFFPGLFVNHRGGKRNVPIVRIGNIASMPHEPVATKNLSAIEAYLVEARSVGGLSGSPVFVQLGIVRPTSDDPGAELTFAFGRRSWYLLGVMHGHWDAPTEDLVVDDGVSREYVNMGIAVVTPVSKLLDLFEIRPLRETFEEMGRRTREAIAAGTNPRETTEPPLSL